MMTERIFNTLFICSGNSARSILAESILQKDGAGKFTAFSAGSQPRGKVNPLAIEVLESFGYPTDGLRSKSWDEFAVAGAPAFDFVFTVCDNAAGEACPVWPGKPMSAHWGIEDPAAVTGTPFQQKAAFIQAFRYMKARVVAFAALPVESLERASLLTKLSGIGQMDGTTSKSSDVD